MPSCKISQMNYTLVIYNEIWPPILDLFRHCKERLLNIGRIQC